VLLACEGRTAHGDPQQSVVTARLQWPLAKYNGRSFSDSAGGSSAGAAIGMGWVLRQRRRRLLTVSARSRPNSDNRHPGWLMPVL
jgi:hypothetical protein